MLRSFSIRNGRRRDRRLPRRIAGWVCCLLLAAWVAGAQQNSSEDRIVVIVHPENSVSELKLHDLRLMYGLYRRVWSNGNPVRLALPAPETPSMDFLVDRVFRTLRSEGDVDRFYLTALFQLQIGKRPEHFSARDSISFVRSVPGGVALIRADEIPDDPGVRVLEIGGPSGSP